MQQKTKKEKQIKNSRMHGRMIFGQVERRPTAGGIDKVQFAF